MAVMLERWNDDKMDALAGKVDDLGLALGEQAQELRGQAQELHEHRKETKQGFESLHRMLVYVAVALPSSFIVGSPR